MKMKKSQVTKIIYNCCYFFPSGIHRQCWRQVGTFNFELWIY
jgi:hypothetical protein